jgi:mRNA interferase MazF
VTYNFGDLLLVKYPFSDLSRSKVRPGVVLLDVGDDDVVVARLTSHQPRTVHDLALQEWKSINLPLASFARLHKMTTINKSQVIARTGQLSQLDQNRLRQHLKEMWEQ